MTRLIILQANERLAQHADRSLDLVEIGEQPQRRRELNQPFEERLVGFRRAPVKIFDRFVRREKAARVE